MTINDYMNLKYPFEIIPDESEGGYVILYPDLPGCLSQGETIDKAIKNGEDARLTWISSELEEGNDIPLPNSLNDFSGQFRIRIPKNLHKRIAIDAKREGVSMNQYILYLLSRNEALENA